MRYIAPALALSLAVAVTASVGVTAERQPDPRALSLVAQGKSRLATGDVQGAIDSFEAALVVDPGYTAVYVDLGEAARHEGLQGQAIHYYRLALQRDPKNLAAISGEGEAMLEKGAVEKAKRNLAQLQSLCGGTCAETRQLAAAIEAGPPRQPVLTADAVSPDPTVTQN
ncbi:MAG TPA: tetratricopeptide repeat protein [Croceibacterium sp.]